jgi:hypothetical protein
MIDSEHWSSLEQLFFSRPIYSVPLKRADQKDAKSDKTRDVQKSFAAQTIGCTNHRLIDRTSGCQPSLDVPKLLRSAAGVSHTIAGQIDSSMTGGALAAIERVLPLGERLRAWDAEHLVTSWLPSLVFEGRSARQVGNHRRSPYRRVSSTLVDGHDFGVGTDRRPRGKTTQGSALSVVRRHILLSKGRSGHRMMTQLREFLQAAVPFG